MKSALRFLKLAISAVAFFVMFFSPASAQSTAPLLKQPALSYEKCIVQMPNVSSKTVNEIGGKNLAIKDAADALVKAAISSCNADRKKLIDLCKASGEASAQCGHLADKIASDSELIVKTHILKMAIDNASSKDSN